MKIFISIIFILFLQATGFAQDNMLIKKEQLSERIRNGKDTVFVINFWATWCGPCVKELPHFEKLNNTYKNDKMKVLLVSVDFVSKLNTQVIPFLKRKKFKTEAFLLDEKDQQAYIEAIDPSWSGTIPATLFITSAGKRKFFEEEFSYKTLSNEYLNFKQ